MNVFIPVAIAIISAFLDTNRFYTTLGFSSAFTAFLITKLIGALMFEMFKLDQTLSHLIVFCILDLLVFMAHKKSWISLNIDFSLISPEATQLYNRYILLNVFLIGVSIEAMILLVNAIDDPDLIIWVVLLLICMGTSSILLSRFIYLQFFKDIRLIAKANEDMLGHATNEIMLDLKKTHHEYMNHIQTLYSILESREYPMLHQYLSTWCEELTQQSLMFSLQNPVLGLAIGHFHLDCITRNIELTITGKRSCQFNLLKMPLHGFFSIIHNLIKNSLEAIPDCASDRRVEIYIEENSSCYRLSFTNTGSYIPDNQLSKLFIKGFTTKMTSSNSGLGLSIAKEYLDHYGGQIDVHSTPNEGTTFDVTLPKIPSSHRYTYA